MAQIGSDSNPMVLRKAIVSKPSRFRKGMDLNKYKDNYDRIFKKKSYSETMQQDLEPIEDMRTTQRKLTDLNWDGA